ncbi:MAG: inositol monophosphatase [Bryobacteraceae bacterium]|nr:inositol monophosphatase [Bryobacteraceae bacterium]
MEIARESGAIIREFAARGIGFELKGEYDLVTEADRTSERHIVGRLSAIYPDHDIIAEEGFGHDTGAEYRWYVDPLDGTTNFAHGFPIYNVTLALEKAGELVAGVVYDPTRDEMFSAEKGAGSWLNGNRIHVSRAKAVADSLVSTGFPSPRRHLDVNIHFYFQLAMLSHGVRRAGAAAIDLAYVACGRLDAFWEFGLKPWDQAAGILLTQEAGGRASDMRGGPVSLNGANLLVDNGLVHDEILLLFDRVYRNDVPFQMIGLSGT